MNNNEMSGKLAEFKNIHICESCGGKAQGKTMKIVFPEDYDCNGEWRASGDAELPAAGNWSPRRFTTLSCEMCFIRLEIKHRNDKNIKLHFLVGQYNL